MIEYITAIAILFFVIIVIQIFGSKAEMKNPRSFTIYKSCENGYWCINTNHLCICNNLETEQEARDKLIYYLKNGIWEHDRCK